MYSILAAEPMMINSLQFSLTDTVGNVSYMGEGETILLDRNVLTIFICQSWVNWENIPAINIFLYICLYDNIQLLFLANLWQTKSHCVTQDEPVSSSLSEDRLILIIWIKDLFVLCFYLVNHSAEAYFCFRVKNNCDKLV